MPKKDKIKQKQSQKQTVNITIGGDLKKKKRAASKKPSGGRVQSRAPTTIISYGGPVYQQTGQAPPPSFEDRTVLKGATFDSMVPKTELLSREPVGGGRLATPVDRLIMGGKAEARREAKKPVVEKSIGLDFEKIKEKARERKERADMDSESTNQFQSPFEASASPLLQNVELEGIVPITTPILERLGRIVYDIDSGLKRNKERMTRLEEKLIKKFQSPLKALESPLEAASKQTRRNAKEMGEAREMGLKDKPERPKRSYVRRGGIIRAPEPEQNLIMTPLRPEITRYEAPFQNTKDIDDSGVGFEAICNY